MSDVCDITEDRIEKEEAALINAIRACSKIEPGKPGNCELCGEWSGRLIDGACAPCRDKGVRK
jgi:hypothetical protein